MQPQQPGQLYVTTDGSPSRAISSQFKTVETRLDVVQIARTMSPNQACMIGERWPCEIFATGLIAHAKVDELFRG